MAAFRYYVRSSAKNKLAKIQVFFTVGRGNQFYVDSGMVVPTDAWSDKTQGIKSRYVFTDDFTAEMGLKLMSRLADLRSFILKAMAEDGANDMIKPLLEKIIYRFHHPKATIEKKRETLRDYIVRYAREIEDGTRLNIHKLRYGYSTVKNYKGFIVQFDEFCKARRKRFDFEDIDIKRLFGIFHSRSFLPFCPNFLPGTRSIVGLCDEFRAK